MSIKRIIILQEIFNSIVHGIGFIFALVGLIIFLALRDSNVSWFHTVGMVVFTITAMLLYLISVLYHSLVFTRAKKVFQILDCSAIYLFIAATYTAFLLSIIGSMLGILVFLIVWIIAISGIVLKSVYPNLPIWINLSLYLCMGWLGVFTVRLLPTATNSLVITYLIMGGVLYTLGTIFYSKKDFYFNHTIWHLFVLLGSIAHYIAIYTL